MIYLAVTHARARGECPQNIPPSSTPSKLFLAFLRQKLGRLKSGCGRCQYVDMPHSWVHFVLILCVHVIDKD